MAAASLDTLDTLIHFDDLGAPNFHGPALTQAIARKTLFQHFIAKGHFIEGQLPEDMTEQDFSNTVVSYDTTRLVSINGNANTDGLISYWLMPPHASGRCWLPSYALIIDDGTGYRIVNEGFLPDEFIVDRAQDRGGEVIIEGVDRDCHDNVDRRAFRVRLAAK